MKKSYSIYGDVTAGQDTAGGLIGTNNGEVSHSYAATNVSTEYYKGAVVADSGTTETYWDEELTGLNSGGTEGMMTSEMTGSNASSNMVNLDFDTTWETVDGEYPRLQVERNES